MSDYAFVHEGKAFTPNRTAVSVEGAEAHNQAVEAAELAYWQGQPDRMLAYYRFPAEHAQPGQQRAYRSGFSPRLHNYPTVGDVLIDQATVTTWPGKYLGTIIAATVYRHNFGSRMVAITVKGSNGAIYHGRASWDWGSCVRLRKAKR